MGFLDQLKTLLGGHGGADAVRMSGPLTVADAKKALARVAVQQPLLSMRNVAEALHDLQQEAPAFVTYGMDHYFNSPKLVRFQNSGGRQIDVDAIATLHAQPGPLADEVTIQHLLDDIDDRRGHASADAQIGRIDIAPLASKTAEVLGGAKPGDAASRSWLFAVLDQIDTIDEATGGNLKPLADALEPATGAMEATAGAMRAALVGALAIEDEGLRAALLDPSAVTDAYDQAVKAFERHGIAVPETVELG